MVRREVSFDKKPHITSLHASILSASENLPRSFDGLREHLSPLARSPVAPEKGLTMPRKSQAATEVAEYVDATQKAREMAGPGDWLALALEHHDQIRSAFRTAETAPAGGARVLALKGLAAVLNGHSLAEEVVLYPALAEINKAKHADTAYAEQTEAKIMMWQLERIDPADAAWRDQLIAIKDAVLHHMAEEEGTWFLEIKEGADDQAGLTARYKEEFDRYTRTGIVATNGG